MFALVQRMRTLQAGRRAGLQQREAPASVHGVTKHLFVVFVHGKGVDTAFEALVFNQAKGPGVGWAPVGGCPSLSIELVLDFARGGGRPRTPPKPADALVSNQASFFLRWEEGNGGRTFEG